MEVQREAAEIWKYTTKLLKWRGHLDVLLNNLDLNKIWKLNFLRLEIFILYLSSIIAGLKQQKQFANDSKLERILIWQVSVEDEKLASPRTS